MKYFAIKSGMIKLCIPDILIYQGTLKLSYIIKNNEELYLVGVEKKTAFT